MKIDRIDCVQTGKLIQIRANNIGTMGLNTGTDPVNKIAM